MHAPKIARKAYLGEGLLAGHTITSFDEAISQLTKNSLDAKSSIIQICINPESLSATVKDNGNGIGRHEMDLLGLQHCTSHASLPISASQPFDRKGLSLFALAQTSTLTITSRRSGDFQTWRKSFAGGSYPVMGLAARQQCHSGTEVALNDFMAHQPVRRRQLLACRQHTASVQNIFLIRSARSAGDM